MINPYNVTRPVGVAGAKTSAFPQNYQFELTMDTWWSAVQRARLYSDFTGLDALYSYVMKSSTIIRSAIDKRLRPLKARTFGVYINGKEDERLTKVLKDSRLMRQLIYQKGLSNFTFARVIGVDREREIFVYPLRNLDVVNKAVKGQTYDVEGKWRVKNHVNLFWMQTDYDSEDTLGLLEPIARDYINMVNSQNNWQTASNFLAYQQMMMYYENGDEEMEAKAREAAAAVGLGQVIVSGRSTNEETGKEIKNFELENVYGSSAADTFRIFKENIEQLRASIMQLVIGSSLLGMSDKNTNSERLVRAHLKMFRDICEDDAIDVQGWLNKKEVKTKLSYLLDEPTLANAELRVKPSNYIDIGDVETFTKMMKDLGIYPTESFIEKTGLDDSDVILAYGEPQDTNKTSKNVSKVRKATNAARSFANMVVDGAKRIFNGNKPGNGAEME